MRALGFLFCILIILVSCDGTKEKKAPDPLSQLSSSFALLKTMVEVELLLCEVFAKESKASKDKDNPDILRSLFAKTSATCSIIEEAAKNNEKIAKTVVETKHLPSGTFFLFLKVEARGDDRLTNTPIGLFNTSEECNTAEELYRKLDIATRLCRAWDSKNLSWLF